jgi:leucyl-tRNA synthetase
LLTRRDTWVSDHASCTSWPKYTRNRYTVKLGIHLCIDVLSKSRGAFVEVPYFLSKYDPDPLRFYLTATAPETCDTEFSWEDFVERNNNELVAT